MSELLDFLYTQLSTNQMLVAGIGTVLSGTIMYTLKAVPNSIYMNIKRLFTIEFTITTRNHNYDDVLRVLEKHKVNFFSRNFALSRHGNKVTPGYGTGFSFVNGRLYIFHRKMLESKMSMEESTSITILSRDKGRIVKLVDKASDKEDLNTLNIYLPNLDYWGNPFKISKRPIETVYINGNTKETILERIQWFLDNEKWFIEKGIPYKLTILLYGEPGTGKTSFVKAIASHFDKNIRYIDNVLMFDSLVAGIVPDKDIVLVEDLDRILGEDSKDESRNETRTITDPITFEERTITVEQEKHLKGKSIHKMLNAMDGVKSQHGSIIIFTANDISELDEAFMRKGRMDIVEKITLLNDENVRKMFKTFYNEELEVNDKLGPMKGSDLQDIFMTQKTAEEARKEIINVIGRS